MTAQRITGRKNRAAIVMILLFLLVGVSLIAAGCTVGTQTPEKATPAISAPAAPQPERVEVYHFHRTQQCYSCKTVGEYAEETVKTRFADELQSGRVVFGHINIELPENRALVDRYGPTGSSLWIGVYNKTGFHKEEDLRVWYKIGDKDEYITYLGTVIRKKLDGELS